MFLCVPLRGSQIPVTHRRRATRNVPAIQAPPPALPGPSARGSASAEPLSRRSSVQVRHTLDRARARDPAQNLGAAIRRRARAHAPERSDSNTQLRVSSSGGGTIGSTPVLGANAIWLGGPGNVHTLLERVARVANHLWCRARAGRTDDLYVLEGGHRRDVVAVGAAPRRHAWCASTRF
ncbi:hypothetical protein BC628DRAFT_1393835 [Trametes gibbosa]|nr:hypothetical protein BC628DRAFT_1393835 [Trametes gibbosa]